MKTSRYIPGKIPDTKQLVRGIVIIQKIRIEIFYIQEITRKIRYPDIRVLQEVLADGAYYRESRCLITISMAVFTASIFFAPVKIIFPEEKIKATIFGSLSR